MFALLFALLILDGILLMVVVLLQAGKGGGLAAMGGAGTTMTDSFVGGRQAATILTRTTWTTGAIFLGLALVLSVMSSRARSPDSILRDEFQQTVPVAPQPILPGAEEGASPPGDAGAAAPGEPVPLQPDQ